ncbi:MAG TPA: hypothetical protein VMP11_04240 [Verrucomicrobiae bacterium]|nr:hypothetical protein [Verrucomicrobiae bacterium]
MDITFECPHCAQPIAIDESGAGLQVDCPGCQSAVVVPQRAGPPPQTEPAPELAQSMERPKSLPSALAPPPNQWTTGAEFQQSRTNNSGFWTDVPKAFDYPFRGNGTWILLAGTPFLLLFNLLGFGLFTTLAKLVLLGVFGMLFQRVIQASADEDDGMMEWGDIGDTTECVVASFQVLGMGILVFAPALVCLWSAFFGFGREHISGEDALMLAGAFAIVGVFCLPMAFLALAMFDTIKAVNPVMVVAAIIKTFFQYLMVIGLLAILWFARVFISLQLYQLRLAMRLLALLPAEFVTFYTLAVSARLLGILYRHNAGRLHWFE